MSCISTRMDVRSLRTDTISPFNSSLTDFNSCLSSLLMALVCFQKKDEGRQ